MDDFLAFLTRHGYLVLFGWVLLERVGLPLPAVPVLLAAGALVRAGRIHAVAVIALAVGACLLSDGVWFEIGRRRGARFLGWLCRISLEPDACVRKATANLGRHGARALLVAKFVPGLNVVAVPIAGMLRMSPARFLLFDAAGSLIWVMAFMAPGYLLSAQLEMAAAVAVSMGAWILAALLGSLAAYASFKYIQRVRSGLGPGVRRIDPLDVIARMEGGEPPAILDLRHESELASEPRRIPGAINIPVEQLQARLAEIPRDREIVLYCT